MTSHSQDTTHSQPDQQTAGQENKPSEPRLSAADRFPHCHMQGGGKQPLPRRYGISRHHTAMLSSLQRNFIAFWRDSPLKTRFVKVVFQ
jgi:hypothetical protein